MIRVPLSKEWLPKIYLICLLFVVTVQSLNARYHKRYESSNSGHGDDENWRPILKLLARGRRTAAVKDNYAKARMLYNILAQKLLRQDVETTTNASLPGLNEETALVVENELKESLIQRSAAQYNPFVQHKGKNDFLVIKPNVKDDFVTVIPNDIYYNVEKSCVNWLDDCNIRGLRGRLLQRVRSP